MPYRKCDRWGIVVTKTLRHLVSAFPPVNEIISTNPIKARQFNYLFNLILVIAQQDINLINESAVEVLQKKKINKKY